MDALLRLILATTAASVCLAGCVFGGSGDGGDGDVDAADDRPRFPSGHLFRKKISITPTAGDQLFDFMLAIHSARDTDIAAVALDDGSDLLLTETDGTPVPFELESVDSDTGAFALWVKMSPLEAKTFYLYYGATESSAVSSDIWPADFRAVWHGGRNGIVALDSSKSGLDAPPTKDSPLPNVVAGVAGIGFDFLNPADSARFELTSPPALSFSDTSFTYSAWVYIASPSPMPMGKPWDFGGGATADPGYGLDLTGTFARATLADAVDTYTTEFAAVALLANRWVHLVATVNRSTNLIETFVDGTPRFTSPLVNTADFTPTIAAARLGGPDASPFAGMLDEVRVSSSIPDATRVQAEYLNLVNMDSTFFTIGSPEAPE